MMSALQNFVDFRLAFSALQGVLLSGELMPNYPRIHKDLLVGAVHLREIFGLSCRFVLGSRSLWTKQWMTSPNPWSAFFNAIQRRVGGARSTAKLKYFRKTLTGGITSPFMNTFMAKTVRALAQATGLDRLRW